MQVIVLGMHRSGTSVLARLLNMMGIYFGPEGVATRANQENPKGFWERRDVRQVNDRLLQAAGADWDKVGSFAIEKIPQQALEKIQPEMRSILLDLDAHRPWFIKEPRLCLLFPVWQPLLEMPICIHIHRHPLEVALSLRERNGFSIPLGLALWERYTLAAFTATTGLPRILIPHAQLLRSPMETLQVLAGRLVESGMRGLREPAEAEINAFIKPNLHHHRFDDHSEVRDYLLKNQRELLKLIESSRILDRPATELPDLSAYSLDLLKAHDFSREKLLELRNQLIESETKISALKGKVQEKNLALLNREQRATIEKQTRTLQQQTEKIQAQQGAIERREQQLRQQSEKILAQQQAIEQREQQLRQQSEKILAQQQAVERREQQLRQQSEKILAQQETIGRRDYELQLFRDAENRWKKDYANLAKWSDRVLDDLSRVLESNRWRIGCWLSLKSSGSTSKEARRLAQLLAKRPQPQASTAIGENKDVDRLGLRPGNRPGIPNLQEQPAPAARSLHQVLDPSRSLASSQPELLKKKCDEALAFRLISSARNALPRPPRHIPETASVCCIVLHQAGEERLQNLLSSFLQVNTFKPVEFRIVLHGCADRSRQVIESFQDRLSIDVTEYADNKSFAYSNNRVAEATDAQYLLFLNDDIIFQDDVIPELVRCLQDSRNGLVGLRLFFPSGRMGKSAILQHAGIKFSSDPKHFFYRPFNLGIDQLLPDSSQVLEKFPAVTAALAGCRRADFLALGGFCEKFRYGYEDVDLCLSFRRVFGLRSVSANYVSCIHDESATRRADSSEERRERSLANIDQLVRRHGWYLRRQIMRDRMLGGLFFSDQPLTVALTVTESGDTAAAGDFFTASEFGRACEEEFGWRIRYLSAEEDWYDVEGVDVLIVLLDSYELAKVRNAAPELLKIAWLRNWFDRWASRADFDAYDLYLCSSKKSARWLRDVHRKPAWFFPLATNPDRFTRGKPTKSMRSDYCFTGSYWQADRDIATAIAPAKLPEYQFTVFGKGWEAHPNLAGYTQGFRPYWQMPNVYASTRVVVDDANHVTKEWASVNSRVFDALAAGALVITNGEAGAAELFDGQLPTYSSPEELEALLRQYLSNEEERRGLVDRLRRQVLSRHTYRHRARNLKRILIDRARRGYRIAFKIGAPSREQARHWGDYHFARSLGRCFAAKGHSFRIDCLDEWERPETFGDDVVIVLRGLSRYRPKPGQINLMWNISHPDKIDEGEYEEFDHVFVASEIYAAELATRPGISVSALLQCTDPEVFYPDPNPEIPSEKLLFVGNSRKQYREAVRFAVEAELPLGVYGTHWPMFIAADYIRGEFIDNSSLRQHYSRCEILLNDHWPSMREAGFISNRLFDGAAAGAFVISDAAEGVAEIFGPDLVTYKSQAEFLAAVDYYLAHPDERRRRAERVRARVLEGHIFADRAEEILTRIRDLDREKRSPGYLILPEKDDGSTTLPVAPMTLVTASSGQPGYK